MDTHPETCSSLSRWWEWVHSTNYRLVFFYSCCRASRISCPLQWKRRVLTTGSPGKPQIPPLIVHAFLYLSYPAVRNVVVVVVVVVCKHLIFLKKKKKIHAEREKPLKPEWKGGGVRRSQGFQCPGESWTLTRAAQEEPAVGRGDGSQQ